MSRKAKFNFSRTRRVQTAHRYVAEAYDAGVIMNRSAVRVGRDCEVDGRRMRSFGSCSYLALDAHPALVRGVCDAVVAYGTQVSLSRAYLESPLYEQLEHALQAMTGGHVLVGPSTSLCHLAALPVLVEDDDAVFVDQFAHASLHTATDLLHSNPVEIIRHNQIGALRAQLQALPDGARAWYVVDGVYSMLGDHAPYEALKVLLADFPGLHLYVDDAHAVSWTGEHGRGSALTALGHHERVVVALSLNKAFAAAGGALVLPSAEQRTLVRRCGGPMLFSGPIQPPMLGAALASARVHLSDELPPLQQALGRKISLMSGLLRAAGIPIVTDEHTPIFLVQFDATATALRVTQELREEGFYCCPSLFPAVPINKPSVRFTVSLHNEDEDIAALVAALERSVGRCEV